MSETPVKPEPTSPLRQNFAQNMVTSQAGQPMICYKPPPVVIPPTAPHHQHCFTPEELGLYGARPAMPNQPADPLIPALEAVNAAAGVYTEDKENVLKSSGQKRKNDSAEPKELKKRRKSRSQQPKPVIPLHPTVFTYSLDGQLTKTTEGQMVMNLLREGGWPGAVGMKTLCSLICDPILDFCAKRFYPNRRELREYLGHLLKGFPQANLDSLVGNGNDKGFMEKAVYNRRRIRMGKESGN